MFRKPPILIDPGDDPMRLLKFHRARRRGRFSFGGGDGIGLKTWVYIIAGIIFVAWVGSMFLPKLLDRPTQSAFAFGLPSASVTPLRSTEIVSPTATHVPSPSATNTMATMTVTPVLHATKTASPTPQVIIQTVIVRSNSGSGAIIKVVVTQVVVQTRIVPATVLVSTTPQRTQTPWIMIVTATPTKTATPSPSPSGIQSPTLTLTAAATSTPSPSPSATETVTTTWTPDPCLVTATSTPGTDTPTPDPALCTSATMTVTP